MNANSSDRSSQPIEAAQPASSSAPAVGDWKIAALASAPPYCLGCEKEGHRTDECHSTRGFNSPRDMEMARLSWIAGGHLTAPSTGQDAAQAVDAPTDAMVDAYLKAQRATVEEADRFGRPNVGGLHTNTVREACRNGLAAALAAQGDGGTTA